MVVGALVFSLLGYDGPAAVWEIFVAPLVDPGKWQDLGVKAAPLIMIAVGLSIGFRANVWNIGAEGQYVIGGARRHRRRARHLAAWRAGGSCR